MNNYNEYLKQTSQKEKQQIAEVLEQARKRLLVKQGELSSDNCHSVIEKEGNSSPRLIDLVKYSSSKLNGGKNGRN